MNIQNYYYYILNHMDKYDLTTQEVTVLFFLRFFNETNQEVDMELMSTQMQISIEEVATYIEKLLEKKYITILSGSNFQYDTNAIFKIENAINKENYSLFIQKFEMAFNRAISQKEVEKINDLLQQYDHKLIEYAIREALLNSVKNMNYIEKILMNWKKQNFTVEDYENRC